MTFGEIHIMTLHSKTVVAACVAGLSGIAVIVFVMWGYDYLDISRSAVAQGSWTILCPMALICTWLANGRLWPILATTLFSVFLGASCMILLAYPGNANVFIFYAAFLALLMTPAVIFGCIIGYFVHKIHMRWILNRAEQGVPGYRRQSAPPPEP